MAAYVHLLVFPKDTAGAFRDASGDVSFHGVAYLHVFRHDACHDVFHDYLVHDDVVHGDLVDDAENDVCLGDDDDAFQIGGEAVDHDVRENLGDGEAVVDHGDDDENCLDDDEANDDLREAGDVDHDGSWVDDEVDASDDALDGDQEVVADDDDAMGDGLDDGKDDDGDVVGDHDHDVRDDPCLDHDDGHGDDRDDHRGVRDDFRGGFCDLGEPTTTQVNMK